MMETGLVAHQGRYIAYLRVSTDRQGGEGYGIEAQRKAVRDRLDGGKWKLIGEYVEVESGRRRSRPKLAEALAACKKHKAKLIVGKLDWLARDTRFLLAVLDSGVEVLFCDLPQIPGAMGCFLVTLLAVVAELEAGLISERTKAALAAAKRRGVQLGVTGAETLAPRWRAEAAQRAATLAPIVRELQSKGYSLRRMAAELTRRKIATPRGGKWHAETVKMVVRRLTS
jgi:DNA invertase Pin-like site-specific DNA recombinase